jgi:hypothetical protein
LEQLFSFSSVFDPEEDFLTSLPLLSGGALFLGLTDLWLEDIWPESPSDSEPAGALSDWDLVFLLTTVISCSVLLELSPSFPEWEESVGFLRLAVTRASEDSVWAFSEEQSLVTF